MLHEVYWQAYVFAHVLSFSDMQTLSWITQSRHIKSVSQIWSWLNS